MEKSDLKEISAITLVQKLVIFSTKPTAMIATPNGRRLSAFHFFNPMLHSEYQPGKQEKTTHILIRQVVSLTGRGSEKAILRSKKNE
jgi:hypothetical protein